ncbi:MAG: hypothetical protein C0593_01040 [Marinilabiliales bacterium]|nr:MAG: hypothetical protein C0593_01040 [Marinilabiliales bacterium]
MKLFIGIALLSASIVFSTSCESPQTEKNPETEIINSLMPESYTGDVVPEYNLMERMEYWDVPAVSFAVIDNMEIIYSGAFGVKKIGDTIPINSSTLFQAASVSKPVTATGAMTFIEQGLLNPESDINNYTGEWQLSYDKFEGPVTMHQLLSHSGGLNVGGFTGYWSEDNLPELTDILNGTPPANSPGVKIVHEPGKKFMYSGGGYQVIQQIMQNTSGMSFYDVMKEKVFNPAGMKNSYYAPLDSAQKLNAVYGHTEAGAIPEYGPIHIESAAGGLWTTPGDLGLMLIDMMRAYQGQKSKILNTESIHKMMTPGFWNFGYGYRVQGEGKDLRFSHGGATIGWHSNFIAFPERGQAVVVMTNGTNGWVLWPEIERAVAKYLNWPILKPKHIAAVELSEKQYNEYQGLYDMHGVKASISESNNLFTFKGAGLEWHFIPVAPDTLELLDLEGQIIFKRDKNDNISGINLWVGEPEWSPYRAWDFIKSE